MQPVANLVQLVADLEPLRFAPPVTHVYNPFVYAQATAALYLERYGTGPREVVLLGMNPGPFGMAQTGVPFGDPELVRDFLGVDGEVGRPPSEHPKRPVVGTASTRGEVSGRRLWGWVRDRFGTPEAFFERFVVVNYCPLAFMEASGRNRTPDKLPVAERRPLFAACDAALRRTVAHHQPRWVVGVGAFACQRARAALDSEAKVGRVPHPSPASPAANRGWAPQMEAALATLGIQL